MRTQEMQNNPPSHQKLYGGHQSGQHDGWDIRVSLKMNASLDNPLATTRD